MKTKEKNFSMKQRTKRKYFDWPQGPQGVSTLHITIIVLWSVLTLWGPLK